MGKPACQTIAFGRGVCGVAAQDGTPQLVPSTAAFPGHIACDAESASEVVVPMFAGPKGAADGHEEKRRVIGVVDVDCRVEGGFDKVDVLFLQDLAELLCQGCDWGVA